MTTTPEKEEKILKILSDLMSDNQEFVMQYICELKREVREAKRRGIEKGFEAARELRATGEFFEDMDVVYDKYDSVEDYLATLEGEK